VLFFLILPLSYIFFIFILLKGWKRLATFQTTSHLNVSIIIPFRNESNSLRNLVGALERLEFDRGAFEVIFIDDHSEDNSADLLKNIKVPHKILSLQEHEKGKKTAVMKGIAHSSYGIIVFTDADCTFSPLWLKCLIAPFADNNVRMVLGGVILEGRNHFLSAFEQLEFASLVTSGAAFCGLGKPLYGNSANLAFRKSVLGEFENPFNSEKSSGDDVFLIHNIKRKFPAAIVFQKSEESYVRTDSTKTLGQFFQQRIRWGAKSSSYKDPMTISVSIFVLLFNGLSVLMLLLSPFCSGLFFIFAITYAIKTSFDAMFFYKAKNLIGEKKLLWHIVYFQFIYILYISIIGIASVFIKPTWKGRKIT